MPSSRRKHDGQMSQAAHAFGKSIIINQHGRRCVGLVHEEDGAAAAAAAVSK